MKNNRRSKSRSKRKKIILNSILLTILLICVFFLIFPPQMLLIKSQTQNYRRQSSEITILKQSNREFPSPTVEATEIDASPELPHYEEPTIENLAHVRTIPKDISGKIVVPQAGINLPITQGIDGYKMLYAAGEQYSRQVISAGQIGNYVLASHSTPWANTLFTNLLNVTAGSEIYVSDDTYTYEYEIVSVKRVNPNDVSLIQQVDENDNPFDRAVITLYTCTDQDATQRYVVRGELTRKTPNNEIHDELRKAFEDWYTLPLQ